MMTLDPAILDVITKLGVATPLVVVLLIVIRQQREDRAEQSEERKAITDRYIQAIEKQSALSVDAISRNTAALDRLTDAVQEGRRQSTTEHMELLKAMKES